MSDDRKKGLYGKYQVERNDGKPLKDGCIVLEWGDPNARKGIAAFAQAVRDDGFTVLAEDVERKLEEYRTTRNHK